MGEKQVGWWQLPDEAKLWYELDSDTGEFVLKTNLPSRVVSYIQAVNPYIGIHSKEEKK